MRNLFNLENNNNNTGRYPLFLGEDLGLMDDAHITYPEIDNLLLKLIARRWSWDEFSLSKDAVDFSSPALANEVDIMVKNLSFQLAADSLASRSIYDLLGAFCTNSELQGLLQEWSQNEYVHARAYSYINRAVFKDANSLIEEVKSSQQIIRRATTLTKVFKKTYEMACQYGLGLIEDEFELKKQIILTIGTLLTLERISFIGSFAATFALVDTTQKFDGVGKTVQLIALDEKLHGEFDETLLTICLKDPTFDGVYEAVKPELQKIFDEVMDNEFYWADYLFSEGRKIVGLNSGLVKEYVCYLAKPEFDFLGLDYKYDNVTENPLPWMDDWLNPDKIQIAGQEAPTNNYQVQSISNDLGDEELDF